MLSLKDKLLKAGLVSEEQAQKADADKAAAQKAAAERAQAARAAAARPHPPSRSSSSPSPRHVPARPAAEPAIPKLPLLPGTKQWNQAEARKQQALDKQLREMVLAAQVAFEPGERVFHFQTRKGKLRRLELSVAQATLLEEGKLAVVERPDPAQIEHALVPVEVAKAMLALSERSVRFLNEAGAAVGFLSEEEIHQRALETAAASVSAQAQPTSESAPVAATASASAGEAEVWLTVKKEKSQ